MSTSPDYYARWKIEPLDFIMQNNLPFWLGNVIKYCMRYDAKSGLEDLEKARVYLDKKIEELRAAEVDILRGKSTSVHLPSDCNVGYEPVQTANSGWRK